MNLFFTEEDLKEQSVLVFNGDQLHHFRNVLRGKVGSLVKSFDGKGRVLNGIVESVSKKELRINITSEESIQAFSSVEQLTIGVPKKEYLESIIRSAIQTGVRKINLVQTQFSPWMFKSYPRLDKIMISSLLQSENPFLPELEYFESLEEFLKINLKTLLFSTELETVSEVASLSNSFQNIFIGPEGGFHQSEIEEFNGSDSVTCAKLNLPIMKAEIAVPYCLGLGSLLK